MNPLKIDPTRTTLLRGQFDADMVSRFAATERLIMLELASGDFIRNAEGSIEAAFDSRVKEILRSQVLEVDLDGKPWTDSYIKRAHSRAIDKTYRAVRPVTNSKGEGLGEFRMSLGVSKLPQRTLKLIQSRTFADLKGITEHARTQLRRTLVGSLIKGLSREETAKAISDKIKSISLVRARTIVQTEIVSANAEGALDAMEFLGVEVGVNIEWKTKGRNPCDACKELEGMVMTVAQARGLFPRHPNCYCSPVPSRKRSVRGVDFKKRLLRSIKQDLPSTKKRTIKDQIKRTNWEGAQWLK